MKIVSTLAKNKIYKARGIFMIMYMNLGKKMKQSNYKDKKKHHQNNKNQKIRRKSREQQKNKKKRRKKIFLYSNLTTFSHFPLLYFCYLNV